MSAGTRGTPHQSAFYNSAGWDNPAAENTPLLCFLLLTFPSVQREEIQWTLNPAHRRRQLQRSLSLLHILIIGEKKNKTSAALVTGYNVDVEDLSQIKTRCCTSQIPAPPRRSASPAAHLNPWLYFVYPMFSAVRSAPSLQTLSSSGRLWRKEQLKRCGRAQNKEADMFLVALNRFNRLISWASSQVLQTRQQNTLPFNSPQPENSHFSLTKLMTAGFFSTTTWIILQ